MKPTVAIIGTGPAGMIAAWAAVQLGHPIVLISNSTEPSVISGAQFLHTPIFEISRHGDPDFEIRYEYRGDADTYQKKVYGDASIPFSSWGTGKPRTQLAWSMQRHYEFLWRELAGPTGHAINVMQVDGPKVRELWDHFQHIVFAGDRTKLCDEGHAFRSVQIKVAPVAMCEGDNVVVYNGDPENAWARSSRIQGNEGVEYGVNTRTVLPDMRIITKPLDHRCTCEHGNVIYVGRFGEWKKGVLVHHAFERTMEGLLNR